MTLASVLGLVKSLVYAKVLGADHLGNYGLIVLVTQFGVYLANWGILSALNNQLPMALGRGDRAADELTDRALGALAFTWVVTAGLYLVVVAIVGPTDPDVRLALIGAAVITAATTLCEFYFLLLRVERRLVPLAAMYLLRAVAAIAIGAAAGIAWGFPGVVAGELAALLLAVAVARRRWLRRIHIRRPQVGPTAWLIRRGAPLTFANVLIAATFAIDRIFVATSLPDEFGQYTLASFVVVAWVTVAGMLNQAAAPQLLFEYGAGATLRSVRWRALRIVALCGLAALVGFFVLIGLINVVRDGFLSDYGPGLDAMPIMYVGGVVSMAALPGFLLHAVRPSLSMLAAALGAVTGIAGGAVLAAGDPTINDFAWLFVAAQGVTTVTMLLAVEWLVRRPQPAIHDLPV
jgi:hypothetical protein